MHAHTAPPTRLQHALARWARACVWLLALGVAMQGSVIAMARAAAPAHVHVAPAAELQRDPMLDGVRLVQNHHAAGGRHHHAHIERHAHDATDGDLRYVDDDAADAIKLKDPGGKRVAGDLDTPTLTLPVALAPLPFDGCGPALPFDGCGPALPCAYRSHVGGRLERPPR
jgi:hypothetical protein